jgi:hypothetical protein
VVSDLAVGAKVCQIPAMSSIAEIENAIEKLPASQVDELAGWKSFVCSGPPGRRSKTGWHTRAAWLFLARRPRR